MPRKPLKRFQVSRDWLDTQLKQGVNEITMVGVDAGASIKNKGFPSAKTP